MSISLKRVYEDPEPSDGYRILVERLWPRGVSKEKAKIDLWAKQIAPSPGLRRWYDHDPAKWSDFRRPYEQELSENEEALRPVREFVSAARPARSRSYSLRAKRGTTTRSR